MSKGLCVAMGRGALPRDFGKIVRFPKYLIENDLYFVRDLVPYMHP